MFKAVSEWMDKVVDFLNSPELSPVVEFFSNKYVSTTVFSVFLIYILFINIKTFALFAKDKKLAREGEFRIRESRLLKCCFFGGAIGGYLGMKSARHKTRKLVFAIGVRLMLLIQLVFYSVAIGFFGFLIYMM